MRSKTLLLSIICCFVHVVKAQLPDRIIITDNSMSGMPESLYKYEIRKIKGEFVLFRLYLYENNDRNSNLDTSRRKIGIISTSLIDSIVKELKRSDFTRLKFENFGYDQKWLTDSTEKLFNYIKWRRTYWNKSQTTFIKSELTNIECQKAALRQRIMKDPESEKSMKIRSFIATFYFGSQKIVVKASNNLGGFPWFVNSVISFNPDLPKLFYKLLPESWSHNKFDFEAINHLFYYLALEIYDKYREEILNELALLEFQNEINELNESFVILKKEEYGSGGRYLWPKGQTFKISLKHPAMKRQVLLQFFISKHGNTLYPRDSIKKDADDVISRIQNIGFLMEYLEQDRARRLEINYFDNTAFNAYNIENFNHYPKEWTKYDEELRQDSSVKQFQDIYCGCNFRFDSNYLGKAIFFELFDEDDNGSIWVLLPDNVPVLWFFQDEKAYRYTYKELDIPDDYIKHACRMFDKQGNLIKR